eukprot:COSAG01_NODE_21072_length_919_cov_1.562195_1_plen_102_part_00
MAPHKLILARTIFASARPWRADIGWQRRTRVRSAIFDGSRLLAIMPTVWGDECLRLEWNCHRDWLTHPNHNNCCGWTSKPPPPHPTCKSTSCFKIKSTTST